jgi:hypothetical protein
MRAAAMRGWYGKCVWGRAMAIRDPRQAMGPTEAADLLQQILDDEKAADEKLSQIAESGINQAAAGAAHPQGDEGQADDAEDTPARPVRAPMRKAAGAKKAGGRG